MKKLFFVLLIFIFSISANAQWKAYGPTTQVDRIYNYKDKILAGNWQNIFLSDNNAESWICAGNKEFVNTTFFRCFTHSEKYLYAGFELGIYRSSDEGGNWEKIPTVNFEGAYCMRVYNDSLLIVSNWGRMYIASEKELKFVDISGYSNHCIFMVGKKDTVFVNVEHEGLFISEDSGRNLRDITSGLDTNIIIDLKLRNDDVYVNTYRSCYKSNDNGKTWTKQFDSLNTVSRIYSFYFDKNRIIVDTKQGLKYSDDEGKTWIDANLGLPDELISGLIAKDGYYIVSNTFGIYRSDKAKIAWAPMNNKLANSFLLNITQSGDFLTTESGGINPDVVFTSKDKGVNWETQNPDSLVVNFNFTLAPGRIINYSQKNSVKYSSDNGKTWVVKSVGISKNSTLSNPNILNDTIYMLTDSNYIYKANINILEWTLTKTNLHSAGFLSLFTFKGNLYASCEYSGIYKASDNLSNWQLISNYCKFCSFEINKVKSDKIFSMMVNQHSEAYFIYSQDLKNWYEIPIEIKANHYYDFVIRDNDIYALIAEQGIFKSTDEGETWTDFNTGLNNYEVVKFAQDSTHLYVATQGGGVNVFDFTDLYSAPSLIAPSNKAIKNPVSITFNWSHSNEISKDLFELALDADFKNMKNSSEIKTGDITITNLISDTLYYWRVKSQFPNGDLKTSETWTLSTKYVSSVGLLPGDLLSVAPNPANDNISVNYKFENAEKVNVYLMDVLGNKLYEANGLRNEEHYSINVSQFTAGIYYLVFDTGLNQIKEKIVITK